MMFDFDKHVERVGSDCLKHDSVKDYLGADGIIPMWVADMDFLTPEFITEALTKRIEHGVFGYPKRNERYFTSIIDWLARRHQWKVEKDWIKFSPGVVPSVNMAVLAYSEPGDNIIVQPPVYFPFFTAVTDHDRKLVFNQLVERDGRLCMDFEDLERKAASGAKMLILSSPHNPGGSVWTQDELQQLAAICLKYNVLMLSDEIHCDLVYKPNKHIPLASLSAEISQKTITTVAPSKTFNISGLASSAVIIENPLLRKQFIDQVEHLHIGMGNILGNIASEYAFRFGDTYVDELMDYLAINVRTIEDFCKKHLPFIKVFKPEATFLVWLDCRETGMVDKALNEFFLHEAKIGCNPGVQFGIGGEGFMRMNIGCPKSVIEKALKQLKEAFDKRSGKV